MKKLILAGGGHGHINILKELIKIPIKDFEVILITDCRKQYYSGMLSGFIEGVYKENEIFFDVEKLCSKAGVKYINESIVKIDANKKSITTVNLIDSKSNNTAQFCKANMDKKRYFNKEYYFDFISMNLGASSKNIYKIGDNASYVKPIYNLIEFVKKIDEDINNGKINNKKIIIIGGGASGIELSYSFRKRYPNFEIDVFSAKDILYRFNKRTKVKVKTEFINRKINLHVNEAVKDIYDYEVTTNKSKYDYDYLIVSNGVTGTNIKFEGYDVTKDNFLMVKNDLSANEYSIAMGDMICLKEYPDIPKAGVFAIRQAPILYINLLNMLKGSEKRVEYMPQKKYLQLINYGDKKAILNYGKCSIKGSLAWLIKNYIDKDYMKV